MLPAQLSPGEIAIRRARRATPALRAEVARTLEGYIDAIDRVSADGVRALGPVLEQAERELRAELPRWVARRPDGDVRFTAHSYRAARVQFAAIRARLASGVVRVLEPRVETAVRLASHDLVDEIARFTTLFSGATTPLHLDLASHVATGRSYIIPRVRTSAARYAGNVATDLKREIAVAILRGDSVSTITDRLVRHGGPHGLVALRGVAGDPNALVEQIPEGLFRRYRFWAERVARTEVLSAYNTQLVDSMHAARRYVPDLEKRWCADPAACARICRPIDEQVQPLDHPFDTPLGPVDQAPAHPNCRCRTGAWRAEWTAILAEAG